MDSEAFERAVNRCKDRVCAYAQLILRDRSESQDVAQEAMIRLWQHRDRVEEPAASVWLTRTARNLCIDLLRRRRVRAEVDDGDEQVEVQADLDAGPLQRTESRELGRNIAAALARLSEHDRTVVILREVQGLPYGEIAEILELPLGTVKARLHRARERLRGRLVRAGVA